MRTHEPITIIQDTREQTPLSFDGLEGVSVEVGTLETGDYSIKGHEREFVIERKSADDLVGTLCNGYKSFDSRDWYTARFNRELMRMQMARYACLVVEVPRGTIAGGFYRSATKPESVLGFLRSVQVRNGVHVFFADNRQDAAREIVALARAYLASIRPIKRRSNDEEPPPSF